MNRLERRRLLLAAGALFVAPLARPQQAGRVARIGMFAGNYAHLMQPFVKAFEEGLREFGYADGKNVRLDFRYSDGRLDVLPEMARDLVRGNVDLIVVGTNPHIAAAKQATKHHTIIG